MEQGKIFYRFLLYIRIKNKIISKFISIIEKRGYYKTGCIINSVDGIKKFYHHYFLIKKS